jgi:hypothetical protein
MTRAKAALGSHESAADVPKKGLQVKKSTATLNGAAGTRKRAALNEVTNVTKTEATGAGGKVGGKKPLTTKVGPVTQASRPTKIEKATRPASQSILSKDKRTVSSELKRPLSGSGIAGQPAKKRATTSNGSKKEEDVEETENVMPPENVMVKPEATWRLRSLLWRTSSISTRRTLMTR